MMIPVIPAAAPATDARSQAMGRASDPTDRDSASASDGTFADAMAGVDSRREGDREKQAPEPDAAAKGDAAATATGEPRLRGRAPRTHAFAPRDGDPPTPPARDLAMPFDVHGGGETAPVLATDPPRATRRAMDHDANYVDVQALAAAVAMQGGMSGPAGAVAAAPKEGEAAPDLTKAQVPAPDVSSAGTRAMAPVAGDPGPSGEDAAPVASLSSATLGIRAVSAETALAVAPAPGIRDATRHTIAARSMSVSAGAASAPARRSTGQFTGQVSASRASDAGNSGLDDAPARASSGKAPSRDGTAEIATAGAGWAPVASPTRDAASGGPAPDPVPAGTPAATDVQPQPVRSVSFDIDGAGSDPVRVRMRLRGDSLGLDLRADSENLRRLSTDDLRQSLERAGYAVDSIKLTATAPAATSSSDSGTNASDQQQRQHQPQSPSGAGERHAPGFGTESGAGQGRSFAGQRDNARRTNGGAAAPARASNTRNDPGSSRRDVVV